VKTSTAIKRAIDKSDKRVTEYGSYPNSNQVISSFVAWLARRWGTKLKKLNGPLGICGRRWVEFADGSMIPLMFDFDGTIRTTNYFVDNGHYPPDTLGHLNDLNHPSVDLQDLSPEEIRNYALKPRQGDGR